MYSRLFNTKFRTRALTYGAIGLGVGIYKMEFSEQIGDQFGKMLIDDSGVHYRNIKMTEKHELLAHIIAEARKDYGNIGPVRVDFDLDEKSDAVGVINSIRDQRVYININNFEGLDEKHLPGIIYHELAHASTYDTTTKGIVRESIQATLYLMILDGLMQAMRILPPKQRAVLCASLVGLTSGEVILDLGILKPLSRYTERRADRATCEKGAGISLGLHLIKLVEENKEAEELSKQFWFLSTHPTNTSRIGKIADYVEEENRKVSNRM